MQANINQYIVTHDAKNTYAYIVSYANRCARNGQACRILAHQALGVATVHARR